MRAMRLPARPIWGKRGTCSPRVPWDVCVVDPAGGSYDKLRSEDAASLRTLAAHTPVVVTTGRGWARSAREEELGVLAILSKPYDLRMLAQVIGTVRARPTDSSKQTEHPSSPDGNGLTVAA